MHSYGDYYDHVSDHGHDDRDDRDREHGQREPLDHGQAENGSCTRHLVPP